MTSQTLISQPAIQTAGMKTVQSEAHLPAAKSNSVTPLKREPLTNKLPYQANHRAELLHLHAETEALLQHLQILKQQRLASTIR